MFSVQWRVLEAGSAIAASAIVESSVVGSSAVGSFTMKYTWSYFLNSRYLMLKVMRN